MTNSLNVWQGQKIRLRAVEPSDWEVFHANDSDTERQRSGYQIPFPRSQTGSREWAEREAKAPGENDQYRFVLETLIDPVVVGTLNTHGCNHRNGTFEYGIALFRPHWGKGYAKEAIRLVLSYFFNELRYQKCNATVYEFNVPSMRLHESLGFQLEGRIRRNIYTNGKYYDELIYGITGEEFGRFEEV